MAGVSFKNVARTALDDELSAAATTMKILGGDWYAFTRNVDFYCLLLGVERTEIVKVTGGTSPYFTIERGQEGSSAKDWPRGTLCFQNTSAASFAAFVQHEVFRQGAYNPNGALTSLYFGEKFYQSDDELWWKSIAAGSTEWRLIAGKIFIDDVAFDPAPGSYSQGQALTMEVLAPGADIYYTDDGELPDEDSTLYSVPFVMPVGETTYKARAFGAYRWESPSANITTGAYTITETPDSWTEVIDYNGAHGAIPINLIVFDGALFCFTSNGKLYEYDGDGSNSWTLRADAPSGFSLTYPGPIAATSTHIWASSDSHILYWGTGDSAWSTDPLPQNTTYAVIMYSDNYLFVCTMDPAVSHYEYYTSTGTFNSIGYNKGRIYAGLEPGYLTANGDTLALGSAKCFEYNDSAYSQNAYTPNPGTPFSGAANYGSTTYVLADNGKLYEYNKSGSWTLTIDANWSNGNARGIVKQSVSGTERLWALRWQNFNTPQLYSYAGSGSAWTLETVEGYLPWTTPYKAIAAFNGTIYIANATGHLAKYTGT
jgi:hypothetical protein